MSKHLIILMSLFVMSGIGTIIVYLICNKKREIERKKYFAKDNLVQYEKMISSFFKEKNIKEGMNICDIVEALGYQLDEKEKLTRNHEAELIGQTIYVNKALGYRAKNFGIAHEVAHIIRGDEPVVARDPHSFKPRSAKEQACDYIAAALLLPFSEINQKINTVGYHNFTKKERKRFIAALADEKNVSTEAVIRRIKEIELLNA